MNDLNHVPGSVSNASSNRQGGPIDLPPFVCIVCLVPESQEDRFVLSHFLSEIGKAESTLLCPEILWVSKKREVCPEMFSNLPSSMLLLGKDGQEFHSAILSFLKNRKFDLVEPRLLGQRLCRKLQKMEKKTVPGKPLDRTDLEGPISPGFYRTLVRTRTFRRERPMISSLRSFAGTLCSRSSLTPGTLRILMYHRVADTMEKDILAVTPFAFSEQMLWLQKEGWTVLPLREALGRLEAGSLPSKAVALTFDDGYRDNYEVAAPVLVKLGFPATIFPVTSFVLEESEHRRYRGRTNKIHYLTVPQIQEMKKNGFDFGGHTHTHPLLPRTSWENAQDEILQAKKLLDEWIGEKSTLFAYPNGAYGKDHFRILDALGYEAALSVRPGANRPDTFRYALLRTEISGRDNIADFILKMNGGFDLMHRVTQSVRGFYR